MNPKFLQAVAIAALSVTTVSSADAANAADNDALGIADAKTSLIQAITAAEQQVGGKAFRAEYERDKDQWVFNVEVVKGDTVMDVTVDPASGKVLAATADQDDREDDEDKAE